ncbi:hypothetical protein [Flavobacterium agrisoli]|uniref:DUF2282 domain-containing protein n=1 Tax=Flavobacterium agrisoli TaxID=2793066 RepID=A0A934UIB1_9FLAO|nr:hypothetical protein [Flavobacterium agrisoli]MBK0368253.1 hypothetical protein [Flavobacterium agrisoli]
MKTTFLKPTLSFAAAAVMGISGAFLTTSMQNASKAAPRDGYINSLTGVCDVPVECSNDATQPICQANGQQAFGKGNNCAEVLHMPSP